MRGELGQHQGERRRGHVQQGEGGDQEQCEVQARHGHPERMDVDRVYDSANYWTDGWTEWWKQEHEVNAKTEDEDKEGGGPQGEGGHDSNTNINYVGKGDKGKRAKEDVGLAASLDTGRSSAPKKEEKAAKVKVEMERVEIGAREHGARG